jgi:hypothetical protein
MILDKQTTQNMRNKLRAMWRGDCPHLELEPIDIDIHGLEWDDLEISKSFTEETVCVRCSRKFTVKINITR